MLALGTRLGGHLKACLYGGELPSCRVTRQRRDPGCYIIDNIWHLHSLSIDESHGYNNEVFLRVTNHTGQVEKNLLGPAGIRTRDLRFTSPNYYSLPEFTVP